MDSGGNIAQTIEILTPTEQEIDSIISGFNRKTATFLQLIKETGMRSGEAWRLKWIDLDLENRIVNVTPEKGGNPRVLKMSNKLIAMLNAFPKNQSEVFKGSLRHFGRSFRRQRKIISSNLQNQRISKITFHTLRHWKATMEYTKTKDILHVMHLLGHKSIQNTLLYTKLVNFEADRYYSATAKSVEEANHKTNDILHVKQLLGHRSIQSILIYTHLVNFENDQFTCRVAKTLQEAKGLIEAGFDYITDLDGVKLFRKLK